MPGVQDGAGRATRGRRNALRRLWRLLAALSVGVALGCGVRGPPRPPDAPVTRQQAQQPPKPEDAAAGEAGVQDCEACDLRERALFD